MLNQFKWKLTRFMAGRYGIDQLYMASVFLFVGLQVVLLFVRSFLLSILNAGFIVWISYRVFSKNIQARQMENQRFLKLTRIGKAKGKVLLRRVRDIGTHRYRKCPVCHTTLRLPRKRGQHKVRCPKCGHLLDVKIWL